MDMYRKKLKPVNYRKIAHTTDTVDCAICLSSLTSNDGKKLSKGFCCTKNDDAYSKDL